MWNSENNSLIDRHIYSTSEVLNEGYIGREIIEENKLFALVKSSLSKS